MKRLKLFLGLALAVGIAACTPTPVEPEPPVVVEKTAWTAEEEALQTEFLGTTVPFFVNTIDWHMESGGEGDEAWECISTESALDEDAVINAIETKFTFLGENDYGYWYGFNTDETHQAQLNLYTITENEVTTVFVDGYNIEVTPEPETLEEVMQDICLGIFGTAVAGEDYFDDGEDGFFTGVLFGEGTEEDLEAVITYAGNFVPEYATLFVGPEADTLIDGVTPCFYAIYATESFKVIQLLSYLDEGRLVVQFAVYQI